MHTAASIRRIDTIVAKRINDIPSEPGVYAFWWVASKAELMAANRHIVLKGPGGSPVGVTYEDWWPKDLPYPCLYVGKSTNLKSRFAKHIMRGTPGRLHEPVAGNRKAKPYTTSCQLRWGIEHIFPLEKDPLNLIFRSVGFSHRTDFPANAIAERFFEEDRLVGKWRPWFNIDSER